MIRTLPLLACSLVLAGCERFSPNKDETGTTETSGPESGETAGNPDDARFGMAENVILMVHDGARIEEVWGDESTWGEGWSDAANGPTADILPVMRDVLVPQGAMCKPGYATGITITLPAHVDMLLGKRTPIGHHPTDYGGGYYRPALPSMFELLRAQDSSVTQDQVGFIANTKHMQSVDYGLYPGMGEDIGGYFQFVDAKGGSDIEQPPSYDPDVIDRVADALTAGARIIAVNLHQIDRAGHYNPFEYDEFITDVDEPLTTFWTETIQGNQELADKTLLFLLSDHGRHRFVEGDAPWMHHGDGCSGCREIPILLLGPGIDPGTVTMEPHTIEDAGMTAAWLMGIEMPYGDGMIMTDMLQGNPEVAQRSGPSALHSSGGLLAYQQYKDDFGNRSEVVIDGTVFENPAALHVEQPKIVTDGETVFACWREVTVATADEYWNWQPVCKQRDAEGDWSDLGSPMYELVWPFFDPALAIDDGGRLWSAWSASDTGNAEGSAGVRLARWTPSRGWEGGEDRTDNTYFPVHPAIAVDGDTAWVAWSGGESEQMGRYTRHVELYEVSWPTGGNPSWSLAYRSPEQDASGRTLERIDDATMLLLDGTIYLAFLGVNEEGNFLLATQLDDPDGSWSSTRSIDTSGTVFMHVRPQFSDDGHLHWGRLGSDGNAEVCRSSVNDLHNPQCESTGAPYLESVAGVPGGAWVTTSGGDRQWSAELIEF